MLQKQTDKKMEHGMDIRVYIGIIELHWLAGNEGMGKSMEIAILFESTP